MNKQTALSNIKITASLILGWFFGIFFALGGFSGIVSGEPVPGIIMMIMAAVILPPVVKFVDKKWKFHLSSGTKIVIIIIGLIIVGSTIDTSSTTKQQDNHPQIQQEQQQAVSNIEKQKDETQPKEEHPKAINDKQSIETVEKKTTPSPSKKLDVSYVQMMNYLSNFFTMEKVTPVKGEDRYMGQASNGLATLEIIGNKDNISQASLMIGIPSDEPSVLIENSAILLRFLKNAVPEWDDSNNWATSSMEKIAGSSNNEEEKIYGNKQINMSLIKELGIMTITIKHK